MRQGLIACRQYHTLSGRIAEICAGNAACNLMKEAYVWDAAGNLASHQKEGRYLEGFTYDSLNRVTEGRLTMANGVTVNQVMLSNAYDALGNVCSRNGVGYGYPGADGCVGAVPMAQAASIPSLASAVLPRYQRMARPVTQRPQGAALNRGQLQAPEGRYRRYSEDRPSWDDEADAWSLGFENGTGPAGWQRRPSRTGGRPSASAALPTATRQLATLTATAVTQAAVSSVASSPHAVNQVGSGTSATFYYYDDRGNQTVRDAPGTGSDRTIRYTADGKAHEIQLGSGQTTRFWYGPDGQRYKRTDGTTTTYYVGGVEVVVQNGVQTARRYVAGVALQTVVDGAVQATRYLFHDHLGSLVRIANVDGSVAESLDYTAFGDRRAYGNPSGAGSASTLTPRGFTGHEMVDGMQVIHMNGRIYDPQLGRFLQPDPVIQEPTNAQSWNAYTYVFNNPLTYTDPTGMMSERAWNNVWRVAALVISIVSMNATNWYMGVSTQAGMTAAAAGGFFAGYAATGTLKSAVIGAFSAAITAGIARSGMNGYEQMAAQAVTGGVVESLQGGSFGHGFVAAGLTAAFMPQVGGYSAPVRTALGALIGGTISAVTGGKFANGAISGAVQGGMAKTSSSEAYGSPSGGSSTSAMAMASDQAVEVEHMFSKAEQTFDEFEMDVHQRLQALTQINGDEHAAGFSYRDAVGANGVEVRSYGAVIQTSGSPVISAVKYVLQTNGWNYMHGRSMHTHGFFMPRETVSKLDAAYLGGNVREGQRLVGRDLMRMNRMLDLTRPSSLDLKQPSGSLSTPNGIVRWP